MASEALSDERLEAIRARFEHRECGVCTISRGGVGWLDWYEHMAVDEAALLAEVERLRAREAQLLPLAQVIAAADHRRIGCGQAIIEYLDINYIERWQRLARTLLADR